MNSIWDIVFMRSPELRYVSPPVCEVIFSGSSSPVIVLSERPIGQVIGVVLGGEGGFQLSWNVFPGAICYNIYYIGGDNIVVVLAQCVPGPTFTLPDDLDPGVIVITPITLEGEGPTSDPVPYSPAAPSTTVTVETDCADPQVSVNNFPRSFVISRIGTAGNLTVNFSLTGTAANGIDYEPIALSVIIPNGSSFVSVDVTPIEGFIGDKTVDITLEPGSYTVGSPNAASISMRQALFKIANYGGAEPLFTPPPAAVDADLCEAESCMTTFFGGPPDAWIFAGQNGATVLPNVSIQGKQVYQISVTGPILGNWFLSVDCLNGAGFPLNIACWRGSKIGGATPAGVYNRTSGSDLRASITLQAVP